MASIWAPVFLFVVCALLLSVGIAAAGQILAPGRTSDVKRMPYESGMDPKHDARRRFDIRFHAVAIAFLVFDVELLFLYPWAVANKNPEGLERMLRLAADTASPSRGVIFGEILLFVGLLAVGFIYAWRRGVFRWR